MKFQKQLALMWDSNLEQWTACQLLLFSRVQMVPSATYYEGTWGWALTSHIKTQKSDSYTSCKALSVDTNTYNLTLMNSQSVSSIFLPYCPYCVCWTLTTFWIAVQFVQASPKILYKPIHCHQHIVRWPQSQKASRAFLCSKEKWKLTVL